MRRRAISPVIATIIIVAVTIAIAIAVAGWLMGLWGSYGSVEQLTIMPDSTITNSSGTIVLSLHVKNTGSKSATITKIEVVGIGTATSINGTTTASLPQGYDSTFPVEIAATGTYSAGTQYLIKVYTDSGNVYQGFVVAQ